MTADHPTTKPRTEAGRRMLHRRSYWSGNNAIREAILAIEAEAAQGAAPRAEGLREALEHVLDVWPAPSPEEFARLHRVLTGHDSCSSRPSDERVPASPAALDVPEALLARALTACWGTVKKAGRRDGPTPLQVARCLLSYRDARARLTEQEDHK